MKGVQVTVGIDSNYKLGIRLEGDENLLFPLIGGLHYAIAAFTDRIKSRNGELMWKQEPVASAVAPAAPGTSVPIVQADEYPDEQELPRDKAIEATEYTIESLKMRLEKMKASPKEATFSINPALLAQL